MTQAENWLMQTIILPISLIVSIIITLNNTYTYYFIVIAKTSQKKVKQL